MIHFQRLYTSIPYFDLFLCVYHADQVECYNGIEKSLVNIFLKQDIYIFLIQCIESKEIQRDAIH